MFIRIDMHRFILIQFDSLKHEVRKSESEELINWFKSSPEVKKHKLTISTYYPPALYNNSLLEIDPRVIKN